LTALSVPVIFSNRSLAAQEEETMKITLWSTISYRRVKEGKANIACVDWPVDVGAVAFDGDGRDGYIGQVTFLADGDVSVAADGREMRVLPCGGRLPTLIVGRSARGLLIELPFD
jgi:hypothetical protein